MNKIFLSLFDNLLAVEQITSFEKVKLIISVKKIQFLILSLMSISSIGLTYALSDEENSLSKGLDLYDLGKYEEAITSYDQAIKINPEYADAQNNKKLVLHELEHSQQMWMIYGIIGMFGLALIIFVMIVLLNRKKLTKNAELNKMNDATIMVQREMSNAQLWIAVNCLLFLGGMATLLVDWFPIIAIGVLIFCPYSIVTNLRKYLKLKKYLKTDISKSI